MSIELRFLECLEIFGFGFEQINQNDMNRLKFKNLERLDLSGSNNNDLTVASVLKNCLSLKQLDLTYCKNLTDKMFQIYDINSPIEDLNLSFINVN
jgi:hypothetical protein